MKTTRIKRFLSYVLFATISSFMFACQGSGTAIREFDAQAGDVRLHGRIAGNPRSGCVLIAINGGPGLTSNYMLDLERLAGPDCAVVTYDQRGLGKSSQPDNPDSPESYTLLKYAQDVEAVRLEIKAERIHLFGHSFGGIVAMQYAILYPERVASLIFFGGGPPTWEGIEISQTNFSARVQKLLQAGIIPPPEEWAGKGIDPLLAAYFSDPTFIFPKDSKGGPPEFSQVVSDLTYPNLVNMDLREGLATLQRRVLLMFGKDDPFGIQMAESIRDALKNAQVEYVVIDHCGHFWHEYPDAFYPRLRKFLGISDRTSGQFQPDPILAQSSSDQSCSGTLASGCTVFTLSKGDQVFFGGNDDWTDPDSYYWVDPGNAKNYGVIWIGKPDNVQQGVNEKGLAYDANSLPRVDTNPHLEREPVSGGYTSYPIHILHECATVEEVIEWVNTHQWHSYMHDQMQFADATGDAVIISAGTDGEVVFTRKPPGDGFLVSTNFNVANPSNGYYPCQRYQTATERLNQLVSRKGVLTVQDATAVLDAVHIEGGTSWTIESLVADLPNGVVYLYSYHQFDKPVVLKVEEEIANPRASGPLSRLFPEEVQQEATRRYQRASSNQGRCSQIGKGWISLVLASLVLLIVFSIRNRRGWIFWLPVTIILGPLGFLVWLLVRRRQVTGSWQAALVEAIGDVTPIALAFMAMLAFIILIPGAQSGQLLQILFIFGLPLLLGLLLFQGPSLALATHKSYLRTLSQRLLPTWVAANIGMGGIDAIATPLVNWISNTCSIIPLSLWTVVSLWASTVVGVCVAILLLFLYEFWAVRHGFRAWSVLVFGDGEVTSPSWRKVWWWILLSIAVLFGGVIASAMIQRIIS